MTTVTIEVDPLDDPELCETDNGRWCFFCLNQRCNKYEKGLRVNSKGLCEKLDICKREQP